jgi:hypothetical protein
MVGVRDGETDMIEPQKLIRNGKVAVLVSPGFGAGWSTWTYEKGLDKFVLFDQRLVEACESSASSEDVEALILALTGCDHIYMGGWSDVEVRWVDPGTVFYVNDYDGNESLRYPGDESEGWQQA